MSTIFGILHVCRFEDFAKNCEDGVFWQSRLSSMKNGDTAEMKKLEAELAGL